MARVDPVGFHHYLWANHLAYAATYELGRFAPGALEPDRVVLFGLICAELRRQGLDPAEDVHSILDAGCSLGYLLRHAETSVFSSATTLTGIDIDVHAVSAGNLHLRRLGSNVELMVAGMEHLDEVLQGRRFDVALSCGSLMYLDQARASRAVASLLGHADRAVGLIDRAHPVQDNASLARSTISGPRRDLDPQSRQHGPRGRRPRDAPAVAAAQRDGRPRRLPARRDRGEPGRREIDPGSRAIAILDARAHRARGPSGAHRARWARRAGPTTTAPRQPHRAPATRAGGSRSRPPTDQGARGMLYRPAGGSAASSNGLLGPRPVALPGSSSGIPPTPGRRKPTSSRFCVAATSVRRSPGSRSWRRSSHPARGSSCRRTRRRGGADPRT